MPAVLDSPHRSQRSHCPARQIDPGRTGSPSPDSPRTTATPAYPTRRALDHGTCSLNHLGCGLGTSRRTSWLHGSPGIRSSGHRTGSQIAPPSEGSTIHDPPECHRPSASRPAPPPYHPTSNSIRDPRILGCRGAGMPLGKRAVREPCDQPPPPSHQLASRAGMMTRGAGGEEAWECEAGASGTWTRCVNRGKRPAGCRSAESKLCAVLSAQGHNGSSGRAPKCPRP
jgi:hypothetical protein